MESEANSQRQAANAPPKRTLLRRLARIYTGSTIVFWPFTDLAMRFFVALPFLRSGMIKAADWDTALLLATEEYPVSWMAPHNAATLGLSIELVAPVLLLFGFLTRPAAFALAALTILAQIVYIPTTTNLMLIAMLMWYLVFGPAAISVDHWWVTRRKTVERRFAGYLIKLGRWTRRQLSALLLLAMRVWLGIALMVLADVFEPSIALATWLPITSFSGLPDWVAILFAILLFTGTAASPVSYALAFVIAAFMISGTHPDVTFYPVLLLGLFDARGAGAWSVDNGVEAWIARKFPGITQGDTPESEDWLGTLREWRDGVREYYTNFISQRASK